MELLEDGKKEDEMFTFSTAAAASTRGQRDIFRLDADRQPVAAPNYTFDCNKKKKTTKKTL